MKSFAEFESVFLAALPQERSDLQGLQGAPEAQLSAWVQHLFQQYLGYTHWKEITREGSAPIGSKGSKQLFPDLRVNVLDNGIIFVEFGYAYPRKKGLARLRVFAGEALPEWSTPDPTYSAWCYVDDWFHNIQKVVSLLKEASRRRAEDMTAGRDAYRRRGTQSGGSPASSAG